MRYKYQTLFKEIGEKGQKLLDDKTVTIAGIGGVGSAVSMFLARAGVNLRLVDKDRVYEDELQRLAIFHEDQVQKFKAKEAKKNLERMNSKIRVKTFHEEIVQSNVFLLDSDVVLDCTNDLKTNELINKHCKKPLIVCRYSGDKGIIFHKSSTVNIEKLKKKIDGKGINDVGIFNPTILMGASIVAAEAIKILLKKKHQKGIIHFNSWTPSISVKK